MFLIMLYMKIVAFIDSDNFKLFMRLFFASQT